jgi:hypothetical protein
VVKKHGVEGLIELCSLKRADPGVDSALSRYLAGFR